MAHPRISGSQMARSRMAKTHGGRQARHQARGEGGGDAVAVLAIVEGNAHRDPLHHLGEIARGGVGGEQSEASSRGRGQADHPAVEQVAWEGIEGHLGPLARADAIELHLLEIGLHPGLGFHNREQGLARLHLAAHLGIPAAHPPGRRGSDAGIGSYSFALEREAAACWILAWAAAAFCWSTPTWERLAKACCWLAWLRVSWPWAC